MDTLTFLADPDSAVAKYLLTIGDSSAPSAPAVTIPAVAGQASYSYPYTTTPGTTITPTIQSVDAYGQLSPVIPCNPASVTVPMPAPPTGPPSFTQALS
jgi:hypothetical protein